MEFHAASRFMQFYLCSTTDLHLHHKTFEEKNKIHNIHVFPARCVKYCSLHRATKQLHLLPKVHSLPSKTFDQFSSVLSVFVSFHIFKITLDSLSKAECYHLYSSLISILNSESIFRYECSEAVTSKSIKWFKTFDVGKIELFLKITSIPEDFSYKSLPKTSVKWLGYFLLLWE